jgi:hypothetical protein
LECEWLDFKSSYPPDSVELLHHILCLANAWGDTDRFLVFGVADDRTIVGVESDPHRRKQSHIMDLLRGSTLNRIPIVTLRSCTEAAHEIDILTIKNRPDKPFFATKDHRKSKSVLRAGVVYTRVGDTNVPLGESAREDEIELMWRERFGIGQSPMQRISRLLSDPDKWQKVGGDDYLYHEDFPEFTIRDAPVLVDGFREDWSQRFPDTTATSFVVEVCYGTTVLRQYTFVACDGGRYRLPLPTLVGDGSRFQIDVSSIPWKIAQLYSQYLPPSAALTAAGVELVDGDPD